MAKTALLFGRMDYELLPGRTIPPKTRALTGRVTLSGGAQAHFESSVERDALLVLDFEHPNARIETQPFTIRYSADGRKRLYTPDILLSYADEGSEITIIFEVKEKAELERNATKFEPKFKIANKVCADRGWGFEILTDDDLGEEYIKNVMFLRFYLQAKGSVDDMNRLIGALRETPGVSPDTLMKACYLSKQRQLEALPALWHLVANKVIKTDLTIALGMEKSVLFLDE
jgi:hypothetical protein